MEIQYLSSSSSTVVTAILFVTVIAFLLLKRKRVNKLEAPRVKGAWPIIGHLPLLAGSKLPHHVLSDMADKYGPIFTMKLGAHQVLVVSNAEMAKECYTTNDKSFASRPKSMAAEIMGYNYALVGLAPYGDYWRKVRKMLTLEVLSQRRVEMLEHVRVSELKASLKDMYETWLRNKETEGSDMVKMEMTQWLTSMILNVVLRILSGKRFPVNNEEGTRTHKAVRDFFELLGTFVVSDFVPFLDVFDIGGYKQKMKVAGKEMDGILEGWVKEHKRERASGIKQQEGNQVFIDVIISILEKASEDDFPGHDHDTVIKAACLVIKLKQFYNCFVIYYLCNYSFSNYNNSTIFHLIYRQLSRLVVGPAI